MCAYYPRYSLRSDLPAWDAAWLADQQDWGPCDLADVTDVCATFRVTAVLRDAGGSVRGHVYENGDYHPLDDATIMDHRSRRERAFTSTRLVEMRDAIQVAYNEACQASRHAAAHRRYFGGRVDPRATAERGDRFASRIADADDHARSEWADHARLSNEYAAARTAALAAVDCDESIATAQTDESRAAVEAHAQTRLDCPPIGWGRSTPDYETRCARWRARTEADRLSDTRPRELPETR
jgi:hypothetical protein